MRQMMTSELKILLTVDPVRGSRGVRELLPHRSVGTLNVMAWRLGLKVLPGARQQYTDDALRAALGEARGNTKAAAAALGCSAETVRRVCRRKTQGRATA